ncbi:nucleoside deaminase [Bacillus sp. HMF5848]|uniref:nucleoside deaminase n=1 Tax=Bacillus sp. HMF5848 TaxID=2495421 RepID=UPI000F772399|nr:nucleoside deaminase [Bacillus sp. HMF5848]RSK27511.1 nucleoside deaminase [Bacillus sp. HMF5848]
MNWSDIPYVWQECFNEAWMSFQEGSRPVGAIVIDEDENIIARGKSATFNDVSDSVIKYNELAHAEVNALLKLDNRVHKQVNNYALYSTLEPCPLCFGAFYMSGIRHLHFAAKDKYGGSTNLLGTTPYMQRKPITIQRSILELEHLSIVLNVYFDLLINHDKSLPVHEQLSLDYPNAVQVAKKWYDEKKLHDSSKLTMEQIFLMLHEELSFVYS